MKTKLGIFFAGISAVAAIAIACLAYWGVFFTDIPETLIRQLRADISAAKEEAVDLRREKRLLQEEVEEAQAELDMVQMEVASAEETRASLEQNPEKMREELDATQREFMALDVERLAYLSQTLDVIVADFTSNVSEYLEQLTGGALRARQLPEFRSWVIREDVHDREVSTAKEDGNFKEMRLLVEERLDAMPSEWKSVYSAVLLTKWANEDVANWTYSISRIAGYDGPKPRLDTESDEEFLESYQERFTRNDGTAPVTGGRVFDLVLQRANLNLLLENDRNRFMNRFQAFNSANEMELSRPLSVQLPVGWTDSEVVERAEQVLMNLEKTRTLLSDLKIHLLSKQ